MSTNESPCHLCEQMASIAPEAVVLDDGTWMAFNVADAPGWTMLAPYEHVEGVQALRDSQAASLGEHSRRLGAAVADATGADRVHVVYLGDTARHFHLGFFPRQAGEDGLFDNARMRAELGERKDPERARALVRAMRDTLGAVV